MQPDADTLDLLYLRLVVARLHHGSALDKSLSMQPNAATLDLLYLRLFVAPPHLGGALDKSLSMQPHADTLDLLYLRLVVAPSYRDSAQEGGLSMWSTSPIFSSGFGGRSHMTLLLPSNCAHACCPTQSLSLCFAFCQTSYFLLFGLVRLTSCCWVVECMLKEVWEFLPSTNNFL